MEYIKKPFYNVGDVIFASNYNMKYDYRKPISDDNNPLIMNFFLVVYSEASDNMTLHQKNYQALKITTSMVDETIYNCKYSNIKNPFMPNPGFISCSKLHTFDTKQIAGCLGQMDSDTMKKVFKIYHRFQCELERQFLERI